MSRVEIETGVIEHALHGFQFVIWRAGARHGEKHIRLQRLDSLTGIFHDLQGRSAFVGQQDGEERRIVPVALHGAFQIVDAGFEGGRGSFAEVDPGEAGLFADENSFASRRLQIAGIVRVMHQPHRVRPHGFDHAEVVLNLPIRQGVTLIGIQVVARHAFEDEGMSVQDEFVARDHQAAKTGFGGKNVAAVAGFQSDGKRVELRMLRRPEANIAGPPLQRDHGLPGSHVCALLHMRYAGVIFPKIGGELDVLG